MTKERGLRGFLDELRARGELKEIRGANWDLEIGGLTELSDEREGPALLFDDIVGYPSGYRIITNIMSTKERTALGLGMPTSMSALEIIDSWRKKTITPTKPTEVSDGPVLENVMKGADIDLLKFPSPKWHEIDGGRMIGTGCAVINRDPDNGWVNMAPYRVQVHGKDLAGLYISPGRHGRIIYEKYHAMGKSCPIAVVCGLDPRLFIAAGWPLPPGESEYDFAGGITGEPVKVISGPTTGLPIPADAEIVIEGFVPPGEQHTEGPFGEYLGYYASGERMAPVIKVSSILFRDSPIMTGSPPLKPPLRSFLGINLESSAAIWNQIEAAGLPGVRAVWTMKLGNRTMTVVSIKQLYPGHAKQAGLIATGVRASNPVGRFTVVVDEDIDVTNLEDVMWAVATRCDPETGIDVVRDCWSTPLDPMVSPEKRAANNYTASRAVINACRPWHWKEAFPKVNTLSPRLREQLLQKWSSVLAQ